MTNFLQFVSTLQQQMNATLSRTDVLRALIWPAGILITATLGLVYIKAPFWLLVVFTLLLVFLIILYGAAYTFCLFTDRDALRSEKYSLNKMAIEHGVYGDNEHGLIEPEVVSDRPAITAEIETSSKSEPGQ